MVYAMTTTHLTTGLPAATLADYQAATTPIYGQAADAVTAEGIMRALILDALPADAPTRYGCDACREAGYACFTGETLVRSGGGRKVYPLSIQCPANVCDDCDEVADMTGAR